MVDFGVPGYRPTWLNGHSTVVRDEWTGENGPSVVPPGPCQRASMLRRAED
ncbi:hypothetical protein GCM10023083_78460 [Streptomyces phyllanthi]